MVDYTEKLTVLQYALEQYTHLDEGQDVPECVVEAFVTRIVVSKNGFDWYLRFDGGPDKPLHCQLDGKRKQTTKIMVSGEISPTIDHSDTGCYQGLSTAGNFLSIANPACHFWQAGFYMLFIHSPGRESDPYSTG